MDISVSCILIDFQVKNIINYIISILVCITTIDKHLIKLLNAFRLSCYFEKYMKLNVKIFKFNTFDNLSNI